MRKDELLTTSELCKQFGVSKQTVYYWLKKGLPYKKRKVGGKYLFNLGEVLAFLDKWKKWERRVN